METIETQPKPWIFLRYRTGMDINEIDRLAGEAFEKLGRFIGQNAIVPAGPPLIVYHDYSAKGMVMDVGFPVDPDGLAKAGGEVLAGQTPSGKTVKAVHKGPYDTYASRDLWTDRNRTG